MKFGKNTNIRGTWKFVELSKEEIEKALDELRETNIKEMKKCADDVAKMDIGNEAKTSLVSALIERQCMSSYTYLGVVLDKKIAEMKSGNYKPKTEEFKKAEKISEKKLSETPKMGESKIEKTFKRVDKL